MKKNKEQKRTENKRKDKLFFSAVIPAYNEKGNVEPLFKKLIQVFKKMKVDYEIIGMIDGDDGAYESLQKLKKKDKLSKIKLFYSKVPSGLGNASKKGYNSISKKATHVITMDADWNHDPAEIPSIFQKMNNSGADIIIGSRFCKGGKTEGIPAWKKFLSGVMNLIFHVITNVNVKDKTSMYRLYKKEALDKIKNKYASRYFEFLPEMLIIAKQNNLKIDESPIHFRYRTIGESKLDIVKTIKGYTNLLYRTIFKKI